MNEIEKALKCFEVEAFIRNGGDEPDWFPTVEEMTSAYTVAVQTLQEIAERGKAQVEFELRILKNYERTISKAYRQRADNATLVQDILLWGTRTAGRTSCCEKCVEVGIDPYEHEVIVNL